jgi:putative spermidine/putrescine transport system permease protein
MRKVARAYDLCLAAAFLGSAALFIVPQFFFVRQSLFENLGPGLFGDALTLENYRGILTDPFYLNVFWRTTYLSAAAVAVGLLLAFPTAYGLVRMRSGAVRWLIILLLISSFVSIVVKVLGLTLLLGTDGPVVHALNSLTLGFWRVRLLHNDVAVVIGLVQYTLPLLVMILFGVVQNIPVNLEEAALVHGATDWRMFRRVILPMSLPGVMAAGLIAFNMNMGAFTSAVLLGGGRVLTIPVLIQRKIILEVDYPNAAALAVLLTIAVIIVNLCALRIRGGARRQQKLREMAA